MPVWIIAILFIITWILLCIIGEKKTEEQGIWVGVIRPVLEISVVFIAAASACFAYLAARAVKQTSQGQLFFKLLETYSSAEILLAVKDMGNYEKIREENSGNFTKAIQDAVKNAKPDSDFQKHRRLLSHFYLRALELLQQKSITPRMFQHLCKADSFKLMFSVIEHIELEIVKQRNSEHNKKAFEDLLKFSGRDDIEYIRKLRPTL